MEEENSKGEGGTISRKRFWKFFLGFCAVILGVFILYICAFWAIRAYKQWQGERAVQKLAEVLKKEEEESYKRAMADTYGGRTPQETLRMYIAAVEKGDYELASRYFIQSKQEEELGSWEGATKEKVEELVNFLGVVSKSRGSYSWDNKEFVVDKPIYVRMKVYPNGVWKIIEI